MSNLIRRPPFAPCTASLFALFLAAATFAYPSGVFAHGEPAQLKDWGGFPRRISRCQRRIGEAARVCSYQVWQARRACSEAIVKGLACDATATDDFIRTTQTNARLAVNEPGICNPIDVQNLRFIDTAEALIDVTRVCRDVERNLNELVFESEGSGATPQADRDCRLAASSAAASLFRFSLRLRGAAIDRIATTSMTLDRKQALLSAGETRIAWARGIYQRLVEMRCPGASFQTVYAQTIDAFLQAVTNQADCTIAGTYAQSAVRCPTAVCGNRVVEPGEQCDDGNDDPGDGCAGCFNTIADFEFRIAD
jgi:cysteine-rich repeat protein